MEKNRIIKARKTGNVVRLPKGMQELFYLAEDVRTSEVVFLFREDTF